MKVLVRPRPYFHCSQVILEIHIWQKKYLFHIKLSIATLSSEVWRVLLTLLSLEEGDSHFLLSSDVPWMLSLTQELGWIWKTENICSSPPEIKHSQDKRRQQNVFILSNDTLTGVQLLNCCVCTNLAYRVILASTPGNFLSSNMYSISFSSQHVLVQSLCRKRQIKFISTLWLGSLIFYSDG